MQDGVHTAGINRLNWMIVGKLPLLPTSQIADLSASPSPLVTGSQTAAVFGMSCINGEKPPAADGAFLGCMAHTKSLKQIGTEHPHKGDMQPINDGAKTTQKTHCPQRASQTSSARTQNATIWSQSITCTSAAENGAGDIWAFMSCFHLWSCNETSKPSVRAFMRS